MIFVNDGDRHNGAKIVDAIMDALRKHGCLVASALRGIEGLEHGEVHAQKILGFPSNLPVVIIAIDEAEKIDSARETLRGLIEEGLMVVDSVHADRLSKRNG